MVTLFQVQIQSLSLSTTFGLLGPIGPLVVALSVCLKPHRKYTDIAQYDAITSRLNYCLATVKLLDQFCMVTVKNTKMKSEIAQNDAIIY